MKEITIYTLSDPTNNEVKYVGITSRPIKRFYEHLNNDENNKKSAWIKNLKKNKLTPIYEVIEVTDELNFSNLEKFWISQFKTWGFDLVNMTDGGEGSYGVSPWNKGLKGVFKHSSESKLKMSNTRKGKIPYIPTEETKIKISKTKKGSKGHKWGYEQKLKFKNSIGKEIFCYNLNGDFIKKYKNGSYVILDGFDSNMVSKVCRGVNKTHKNHIFSFIEK